MNNQIENAYSPHGFLKNLESIGKLIEGYYVDCHKAQRTHEWTPLSTLMDKVAKILETPQTPESIAQEFLRHTNHLHSPTYMGHQVPPPIPLAALFDLLSSATNQGSSIYEMGPFSTVLENLLAKKFCKKVGFEEGDGLITHGGSIANLTALLTARNSFFPQSWKKGCELRPAILASEHSHYSVMRACGILGIGTDSVFPVPIDSDFRMEPTKVEKTILAAQEKGFTPFCLVASACSTPTGAFDPLEELGTLCQKNNLWFHIDGAHGMSALLSRKYRHLLKGADKADSVVWDAHKMMHMPSLVTFVLYKNKDSCLRTFEQKAPYLFDPEDREMAEFNPGQRTLECTKRSIALGLGGCLTVYGEELFEQLIDTTFDLTKSAYELMESSTDFVPLHQPQSNILCFRYEPKNSSIDHKRLRKKIVEDGHYYVTATEIHGQMALRLTLINPFTQLEHITGLMELIRRP